MGLVWLVMFAAYALGFWYGAKLTRDEPEIYTIGNVMIVSVHLFSGSIQVAEWYRLLTGLCGRGFESRWR